MQTIISGHILPFLMGKRGRPWTTEECILAIWGYYRMDKDRSICKSDVILFISNLLPARNPNAVEYKIQNVSACDPRPRSEKPISEMVHKQELLKALFDQYYPYPEQLEMLARHYIELSDESSFSDVLSQENHSVPEAVIIEEGGFEQRNQTLRKRSRRLVEGARKHYRSLEEDGRLRCAICGTSFDDIVEGEVIQMHHLRPICEMEAARKKLLKEAIVSVVPLCPTCHRVVHSMESSPPFNDVRRALIDAEYGLMQSLKVGHH